MKTLCAIVSAVLLRSQFLFSQDDGVNPADINAITSILNTTLEYPCLTEEIINFDKAQKPLVQNDGGFEDPYNTLKHCFIFTYYRDSINNGEGDAKLSVGIFREGNIVTRLDTVIETEYSTSGRIKTIADLNKEGEVDIVITRTLGVSPPPWEEYWIISWNGKRLKLISDVDKENKQSVLRSPWNYLKFIDIDGDGIYELVTRFENELGVNREHIYSWNGKLYGEWGKGSKELLNASQLKKNK